jgi:hypothetical protein
MEIRAIAKRPSRNVADNIRPFEEISNNPDKLGES